MPPLATADLRTDTVTEVLARGKHILMRFQRSVTLHSHLRMDGSWRLAGAAARRWVVQSGAMDVGIRALVGSDRWLAVGVHAHDVSLVPRGRRRG